jgi:hypothetical protein
LQVLGLARASEAWSPAPAPFIIRPQLDADIAAIVAFSLRAWQPGQIR